MLWDQSILKFVPMPALKKAVWTKTCGHIPDLWSLLGLFCNISTKNKVNAPCPRVGSNPWLDFPGFKDLANQL